MYLFLSPDERSIDWIILGIELLTTEGDELDNLEVEDVEVYCFDQNAVRGNLNIEKIGSNRYKVSNLNSGQRYNFEVKALVNQKWTKASEVSISTSVGMFYF